MSAQDLWDKLDALPWPGPWVAHTFEIDCPCPNGEHCGDTHDCAEVEDRTAYPASPEKPAEPGHGQCVVQINTPGLETFAKPCAEFIAAARNELPAIRARFQVSSLKTYFPSEWQREHNISYVEAHLIALKDGYAPMGEVKI